MDMMLMGEFKVGNNVWAKYDLGCNPVLVRKYTKGVVMGPSTSEEKERISVKWEWLCKTSKEGLNNVLPEMISKTCPPLPGGFKPGETVWAKDDLGCNPVLVRKYTKGVVIGPSTSEEKERISVKWESLCKTSEGGLNNVLPSMIRKTCPPLPGGFKPGETVWAKDDLGRDPVLVQKSTKGVVMGPSTSDERERISVKWERLCKTGMEGFNNVFPSMIGKTCPPLPGGFKPGETVWAKDDLGCNPVLVRKYTKGVVIGPSTSEEKERISVKWESLCKTSEGGNNVFPSMIRKTCPPLPGGFKPGETVWAKDDLGRDPVLVQKNTKGVVMGPSTSDERERISVKWERLCKTGIEGSNNVFPSMIGKTCPPQGTLGRKRPLHDAEKPPQKKARSDKQNGERDADSDMMCTICLEAEKSHIFVPCGHLCVCASCAAALPTQPKLCPLCRSSYQQVIQAFF